MVNIDLCFIAFQKKERSGYEFLGRLYQSQAKTHFVIFIFMNGSLLCIYPLNFEILSNWHMNTVNVNCSTCTCAFGPAFRYHTELNYNNNHQVTSCNTHWENVKVLKTE